MRETNNRCADRDNLPRFRRDRTDDAVRVGAQRRIVDGVARERDRAVGAHRCRARLFGGRAGLVEIGVRRPALPCERRQAPFFRFRLNERGFRGTLFGLRLLELQAKIGVVQPRQRIALMDSGARVGEPRRDLAGDAKGEIALDARLDDPSQDLRLLARRIMRFRDKHRSWLSLPRALLILIAP